MRHAVRLSWEAASLVRRMHDGFPPPAGSAGRRARNGGSRGEGMNPTNEPLIIQGGMGVGVSSWRLARTVSRLGQLGVVSGTALDGVVARRLQLGDPGGQLRRVIARFPVSAVARRVMQRFYIAGGKAPDAPFRNAPMHTVPGSEAAYDLTVLASFVEVTLAKQGHGGVVGMNLLEKIQLPNLPALYGALLAGVDYILMGAGIPREIPGALDRLARHEPASLTLHVEGLKPGEPTPTIDFDPARYVPEGGAPLKRPKFLAIIASDVLAVSLARKATGKVDGFVVEAPTAGGHNAPPRGVQQLNERGEPIYGLRDEVNLGKLRELGLPFWLAGGTGFPEKLVEAIRSGAAGIQVGTPFAFCEESGIAGWLKEKALGLLRKNQIDVYTDPLASPTGFPFKVVQVPDTMADEELYQERGRICDLGYLRSVYRQENGRYGYRCPSEPVEEFVRKGGDVTETAGRKCLCNGLFSTIDLGQERSYGTELPIMTSGDDMRGVARLLPTNGWGYSAVDVVRYLLSGLSSRLPTPVSAAGASTV